MISTGSTVLKNLFGGGKSTSTGAETLAGPGQLDTSGWVIGEGDAAGGSLTGAFVFSGIPVWGWVLGALVVMYAIKKKGR